MTYVSDQSDPIEMETIILSDADGNEIEYEYLDTISLENSTYVVLLPLETPDVVIFELVEENGEELLLDIADCDIVEEVYNIFKEANSDLYDFED